MEITSKKNVFIKQLIKEKAKNRFLLFLDTPNLVKEALETGLELKHIIVQSGKQFGFILPKHSNKLVQVSKQVLQELSHVKQNAGIVGVFNWEKKAFKSPNGNYLVLDTVQEAGNVGTLLRSALGAGFSQVYLIDCAAVTNPKVIRASAGAIFKLNIFEMSKSEFLAQFNQNNLYAADLNGENIFKTKLTQPLGLALGNEGNGLSQELKKLVNGKNLTIPMLNNLESLNVAVSGSIIMYQVSMQNS